MTVELFENLEGLDPRKAEAKAAEFYATPASAVRSLIEAKVLPLDGPWLEPFAGSGAIIRAIPEVKEWWALELRANEAWRLVDECRVHEGLDGPLRAERVWCPCDFFTDAARDWIQTIEPRVVITNPPNSRAFDAARLLREWVPEAWLALCQPLSFGSGMGNNRGLLNCDPSRIEWLLENTPDCYKLQDRPDFTGRGGIQEYAWWVWPPSVVPGPEMGWEKVPPRTRGVYRILPPPGWKPSGQVVML